MYENDFASLDIYMALKKKAENPNFNLELESVSNDEKESLVEAGVIKEGMNRLKEI